MPESKREALIRAKKEGFPANSVEEGEKGWYIVPHGITSAKARRAYVACRDGGGEASTCAAVAHNVQNDEGREEND